MLRFASMPVLSEENSKVNNYISCNIVSMILDAIMNCMFLACIQAGIPLTEEMLESEKLEEQKTLFPGLMPPEIRSNKEAAKLLVGLYSLLLSDKAYTPTLQMEYVMAKIIHRMITMNEHEEDLYCRPLPDEIKEEIHQIMKKDENQKSVMKYNRNYVERMIDGYERPTSEWLDFYCFFDDDYRLLDEMPADSIRGSLLNKLARILPDDPKDDEYILPKDWLTSNKFRFAKEV